MDKTNKKNQKFQKKKHKKKSELYLEEIELLSQRIKNEIPPTGKYSINIKSKSQTENQKLEKYMSINKNLFQRVQGIILMYDLTKRETFERLTIWLNIIKQMTNEIPIILVANKLDEEDNEENGRIVETDEGEAFAKENEFQFLEASGLNGTNVDKVFNNISELIIKNLQEDRSSSISNGNQLNHPGTIEKKKCNC